MGQRTNNHQGAQDGIKYPTATSVGTAGSCPVHPLFFQVSPTTPVPCPHQPGTGAEPVPEAVEASQRGPDPGPSLKEGRLQDDIRLALGALHTHFPPATKPHGPRPVPPALLGRALAPASGTLHSQACCCPRPEATLTTRRQQLSLILLPVTRPTHAKWFLCGVSCTFLHRVGRSCWKPHLAAEQRPRRWSHSPKATAQGRGRVGLRPHKPRSALKGSFRTHLPGWESPTL